MNSFESDALAGAQRLNAYFETLEPDHRHHAMYELAAETISAFSSYSIDQAKLTLAVMLQWEIQRGGNERTFFRSLPQAMAEICAEQIEKG